MVEVPTLAVPARIPDSRSMESCSLVATGKRGGSGQQNKEEGAAGAEDETGRVILQG